MVERSWNHGTFPDDPIPIDLPLPRSRLFRFCCPGTGGIRPPLPFAERRSGAACRAKPGEGGPSGKLFLTLAVEDDLKNGQIKEGSVLWNAAGDAAAFAVGNSQRFDAWAFVRAKEGWKYLKLPKPGDAEKTALANYQSVPSKWEGNRLTLTITGSPSGKADAPGFSGSLVVAIDVEAGTAKKLEENIVTPAPAQESR